ncbi:hypothetical protein [Croceicoccus estronivorus]|uniref:hypothetical protein n=1 Tax=Croceicoccus estronivorus TaxID=1172626 RepID=UPI000AD7B650|nr:hypothetical protein [Croceicoccus estronivorus]
MFDLVHCHGLAAFCGNFPLSRVATVPHSRGQDHAIRLLADQQFNDLAGPEWV